MNTTRISKVKSFFLQLLLAQQMPSGLSNMLYSMKVSSSHDKLAVNHFVMQIVPKSALKL